MNRPLFVSFGQNREDVLLTRLFRDVTGTYIDVGACHPIIDSVTKAFYLRGWRGINIEPQREMYDALCADRGEDINLNIAISNEETTRTLYVSADCIPGASLDFGHTDYIARMGGNIEAREVETRTLRTVLREHLPLPSGPVGFLKIDVEGHEREVLEGMCWDEVRPRIVVVEAIRADNFEANHTEWEPILTDAGYACLAFDGINRYYGAASDSAARQALATPICLFDDYIEFARIRTIGWISRKLSLACRQDARTDSLETLQQLLEMMQASPELLNAHPPQLDELLANLAARKADRE